MKNNQDKAFIDEKKRVNKKPSEKLVSLLAVVNFVPPKITLPGYTDIQAKEFFKITGRNFDVDDALAETDEYHQSLASTWEIIYPEIEKYPALNQWLQHLGNTLNNVNKITRINYMLFEYWKFNDLRKKVYFIASCANLHTKEGELMFPPDESFTSYAPPLFTIKNGKITFQQDIVVQALEGISAKRLRICEACDRIYWAYRLDAQTCSTRCANTRRVRIKRQRDKENLQKQQDHFQPRKKK